MHAAFTSKRLRAVVLGALVGLASTMVWAMPRDHVCMIDPDDIGGYLTCLDWLGGPVCCAIYGL